VAVPHLTGSSAHEMKISFPTADGLVDGSDVLEAGAKIGTISAIEPTQNNQALVTISIGNDHWPLHSGLSADIRPKSLLGEKYVDLHDGAQNASPYQADATLQASATAAPVELDQFINSLDPPTRTAVRVLLDDLGAGVAARGNDLNAAIAAGRADLANFAAFGQTLNDRDPDLDKILVGLDGVLGKITTSDQLTQMSQLITNGQQTLNAIESVQQSFSRGFTDANVALADLNTAIDGAVPSLRLTLDIAPTLAANLTQESSLLAGLGATVTTQANRSPNGECTSSTTASQPITQVTGAAQCSPLWMLIRGLLGGPTASGGALVNTPTGQNNPIFRVCVSNLPPQVGPGSCDNTNNNASSGFMNRDGAAFASFLGT
jgi:phospholipid/cholesterol/gamma-HCH transport system substrate-binding protein